MATKAQIITHMRAYGPPINRELADVWEPMTGQESETFAALHSGTIGYHALLADGVEMCKAVGVPSVLAGAAGNGGVNAL